MDKKGMRIALHAAMQAAFITGDSATSLSRAGTVNKWIFDFRPLLLRSEILEIICALFWDEIKNKMPFQVGGLETAAITLVSGMLLKAQKEGHAMSGFYIRKSRRKDGFQKHIEGSLTDEK